jgi:hypothetical protein
MMKYGQAAVLTVSLIASAAGARALGTETFGNGPLNGANYGTWPGVMSLANHTTRVYHTWVNGNEHFYYSGDVSQLNDALQKFGEVKAPVKEVLLRPAPGEVKTFDQKRAIGFNWSLHLTGGIAEHLLTREKGEKVWTPNPELTIYVDRGLDLQRLVIPNGLTLKTVQERSQSMREGLTSTDKTVRGWGAGQLASLDPYDTGNRDAVAKLLQDPDDWVRMNALGAITLFGAKARTALPLLRAALTAEYPQMKERAQESIELIEKADDRTAAEREHRRIDEQIRAFVKARKAAEKS